MLFEHGINRVNLSIYSASPDEHAATPVRYIRSCGGEHPRFLAALEGACRKVEVNMWFLPISGVNTLESHLAFWKPLADEVV